MEEQELNRNQINQLKREITDLGYNYDKLSQSTIKYLKKAFIFFNIESDNFENKFSEAIKHNYSVSSFCEFANISRSTLYNIKNGYNRHECVVNYVLNKQNLFETIKKTRLKKYLNDNDINKKLMSQLLQKEVMYMEMYNQLKEAKEKISVLEQLLNEQTKINLLG